jgi:hypothetical protein
MAIPYPIPESPLVLGGWREPVSTCRHCEVEVPDESVGEFDECGAQCHACVAAMEAEHDASNCAGGGEAHEAHLNLNGECPWGPRR